MVDTQSTPAQSMRSSSNDERINSGSQAHSPVITIAATFTAEPLEPLLNWVLRQAGLTADLRFAPYHQVFQQLLDPKGELAANRMGINVILVRLADFVDDAATVSTSCQSVARVACELEAAIARFTEGRNNPLIVSVLPSISTGIPAFDEALIESTRSLLLRISTMSGVHVVDQSQIDLYCDGQKYDVARNSLAHIPYTDTYFAAVALALARKVHALRVASAKVLVLDCDNTLWNGVVGEDGLEGIRLSEPYLAVQRFAIEQQSKGVLVCLVSKNAEADVLEVLDHRADMLLKSAHLVAHRVNWLPKPTNLRSLATELNLGLDSFVFIDDNPVECALMRAELPEVITLQLPAESQIPTLLGQIWCFDKLATTAEDGSRTRMYRENAARRALESSAADIHQFLAALNLKIDINTPDDNEWSRIEQLTQRTNQFNFTTRRRSVQELKRMTSEGELLRVRVVDRFGDYGLVGVLIFSVSERDLLVDTFLLSCRVLGRGVEHAMLRLLGDQAIRKGLDRICLPYIQTARNEPARAFIDDIAGKFAVVTPEQVVYRIPAGFASQVEHRPGEDPAEVVEARLAEERKFATPKGASQADPDRSARYSRIAALSSGGFVVEQLRLNRRSVGSGAVQAQPGCATEQKLLALWGSILQVDGLGIDDDFFAVGGTSLLSVKLFAEIQSVFGVQLRLTTILEAPTIRTLAQRIDDFAKRPRGALTCLAEGGARNLFLVHDGFGETLLYLNLAQRLKTAFSVYGIEPRRLPGIPLAHGSLEDVAAFYVEQIRTIQHRGPYVIGGMCAGGVIAYAMAALLSKDGEHVDVAILDAARPRAMKRKQRLKEVRKARLREALARTSKGGGSALTCSLSAATVLGSKTRNLVIYETGNRISAFFRRLKFVLLRYLVKRNGAWPSLIPELSVSDIYGMLEASYVPPRVDSARLVVVRATSGSGPDTPYRELYEDPALEWGTMTKHVDVVDVPGGHSSMLQEPAVDVLASELLTHLSQQSGASILISEVA